MHICIVQVRYEDDDFDDSGPRPDPNLEQGMPLPIRMAAQFDPELASMPLEDIDPFYSNQTLVKEKTIIYS
jgi:voltage-gated sodium channel type II alpha